VDRLGGLQDALVSAAQRAKLTDYRVTYLERERRGLERWLAMFFGQVAAMAQTHLGWTLPFGLSTVAPGAQDELKRLARLFAAGREDPLQAYAYCFCSMR
jgi:ClpP class serine protease